jgi:hypothetical protein
MKKSIALVCMCAVFGFGYDIKCEYGVKICVTVRDTPYHRELYFVNMSDYNVRVNGGFWQLGKHRGSLHNRVFNRISKTLLAKEKVIKEPFKEAIRPGYSWSEYSWKVIKKN